MMVCAALFGGGMESGMELQSKYIEEAEELHRSCSVVDAHLDLAGELLFRLRRGEENPLEKYYGNQFRAGGFNLIVSSVFLEDWQLSEAGLRTALDQIGGLLKEIDKNEEFLLVRNQKDLETALKPGRIGILLYLEGMDFIGRDVLLLRALWEMGVRGASLTWSRRNLLADGCGSASCKHAVSGGLSKEGFAVLEEMEELGMFVDVSHLNDDGFENVYKFSGKPFLATHSNSRTVYSSYRNLTDEQIRKLSARGGVMGLNGYCDLVGNVDKEDALELLCRHAEYAVALAGVEHVGYGFDFCDSYGRARPAFVREERPMDCLGDHGQVLKLTAALLQRGMPKADVKKIMGGNFVEYFRKMLPVS